MQNTRFSQLSQVASTSPKHSRQKFWKIFLSVFHDWKFYPWESHEVSHENLWAFSRLDLPPANKSPDWVTRNIKNPNFEKYSKYFSRLDQPATESPIQGNIVFLNFDFFFFAKTKDFPKTAKTLKNLFMFDQQGLSIWKHI